MADADHAEMPTVADRHSFASLFSELKNESVDFVRTRTKLFFSELRDKAGKSRKSALVGGVALIFGSVAFLLFTLAAVGLGAIAFWGTPFAFFWGLLIIGICYALLGAINGIVAYYGLKSLAPQKTIKVLHDDKAWAQAEVIRQA